MSSNTHEMNDIVNTTLPSGISIYPDYDMEKLETLYRNAPPSPLPGSYEETILASQSPERVGEIYMGMGHMLYVYYDKLLSQFVIFHEGGANGYECVIHDDVKKAYMATQTALERRKYMAERIVDGARPNLATDIYNYMISPDNETEFGPYTNKCMRHSINPTRADSAASLDPERIQQRFNQPEVEQV